MLDIFQRMGQSVLTVLGQDAFLRGETTPVKVNIEHGVQIYGEDGVSVLNRDVATIPDINLPKVGDTLTHPDGSYRLDALHSKSGVNSRFILVPYTAP